METLAGRALSGQMSPQSLSKGHRVLPNGLEQASIFLCRAIENCSGGVTHCIFWRALESP